VKKIFLNTALYIFSIGLFFPMHTVHGESASVEITGGIYFITNINHKDKILDLAGKKISYNASTIVYSSNGSKASIADLKLGQAITFDLNPKARFISWPTATSIRIKP